MAKQFNFTHANGTNYPDSYWRITQLFVDVPALYAKFIFTGYKDAQARLDGRSGIGNRSVEIFGANFAQYFAQVTEKIKNPQEVAYEYCTELKDVPTTVMVDDPPIILYDDQGNSIGNGPTTQHAEIVMVSFFEGSTDV